MHLLIDADLIAYEAAAAAEMVDEGYERRSFDWVVEYVDNLVERICEACGVDSPTYLFLTGEGNFRYEIATVKPYKGNRKEEKPFYLPSVRKYLEARYGAVVVDGMEADDALTITAGRYEPEDVTIASRDKDLKQYPCVHYTWECGRQAEWGPELVDEIGELHVEFQDKILKNGEPSKAIKKIWGTGLKWFYAQTVIGDQTDNIPGLEGVGAGASYEALKDCESEGEMFERVEQLYIKKYSTLGRERLLEQARLVWMCREMKDGKPVIWELPYEQ